MNLSYLVSYADSFDNMSTSMEFRNSTICLRPWSSAIFTMSKRIVPRWLINCNTSNPYFEAAIYIYIYILNNRSKTPLHRLSIAKNSFKTGMLSNRIGSKSNWTQNQALDSPTHSFTTCNKALSFFVYQNLTQLFSTTIPTAPPLNLLHPV